MLEDQVLWSLMPERPAWGIGILKQFIYDKNGYIMAIVCMEKETKTLPFKEETAQLVEPQYFAVYYRNLTRVRADQ